MATSPRPRAALPASCRAALLAAALGLACGHAAELPEQLDHVAGSPGAREALERISARAGVVLPRQAWPLANWEIRAFLDSASARRPGCLTAGDSAALRDLLVGPRELHRWSAEDGTVLAVNAIGAFAVFGHDSAAGDSAGARTAARTDHRRRGEIGGAVYGTIHGTLHYASQASIFTEWADAHRFYDRYAAEDGEPSGVPFGDDTGNGALYRERTFARYTAYAVWSGRWLSIKYGRDRMQHGPGLWTGLTTSGSAPPWVQLDTRLEPFPWLSVQATVAEARRAEPIQWSPKTFAWDTRKWLHVHRFEARPLRGLAVGFQNMVVYPDSGGVNPAYLLPLAPLFFSQELAGNRDNAAMQVDFALARVPYASLWGAFLADDLVGVTSLASSFWHNRWAYLLGGRLVSPWRAFDGDLAVEHSAVRPWTYTGGREAAYTFAHYGRATGSELGPDSRTWHARLAWRAHRRLEVSVHGYNLEKGLGREGTLGQVHGKDRPFSSFRDRDSLDIVTGDRLETRGFELGLDVEVVRDGHLALAWGRARDERIVGAAVSTRSWSTWSASGRLDW